MWRVERVGVVQGKSEVRGFLVGWDLECWGWVLLALLGFFVWFRERVGDCADNGLNGFKISRGFGRGFGVGLGVLGLDVWVGMPSGVLGEGYWGSRVGMGRGRCGEVGGVS
jgi:hypothetical protein